MTFKKSPTAAVVLVMKYPSYLHFHFRTASSKAIYPETVKNGK